MAEGAIDTATDVSRTITEVSAALQAAVDRLSYAIATARQPGKPLATISAITREAPLASLFVAFLFGVAVARRRSRMCGTRTCSTQRKKPRRTGGRRARRYGQRACDLRSMPHRLSDHRHRD